MYVFFPFVVPWKLLLFMVYSYGIQQLNTGEWLSFKHNVTYKTPERKPANVKVSKLDLLDC